MNRDKAAILRAISGGKKSTGDHRAEHIEAAASGMLDNIDELQPPLPFKDRIESFRHRINSDKIAASIESLDHFTDLPSAVASYLSEQRLPADIALQPCSTLVNLDWQAIKISHQAGSDQKVAVTLGQWGIAETGSIVINSAKDSPVLLNFLASHHILVIEEKNIFASLEDYATKIDSLNEYRMVCLITGASGTTDIEGVLVNGAHGPEHLHIVTIR